MTRENQDPFANGKYYSQTTMKVGNFSCTLHMPKAVERKFAANGSELTSALPPYNPRAAFPVDEYPASPAAWMHGSGKASSYFVPILPEHGMWLDFNKNGYHEHDVAVLVSVQGINPLTGQKVDPLRLEQYKENCPVHNVAFQQDLYCPECKYKWHPQNYLSSNSTPSGLLWIDGFRTEDGTVRQWYFTEEESQGIAAQLIGAERVYAIGVAFYLSKKPKPKPVYSVTRGGGYSYESFVTCARPLSFTGERRLLGSRSSGMAPASTGNLDHLDMAREIEDNQTLLEIGAGAKINQKIYQDPRKLDEWEDEPAGMIYINYCDVKTAQKILEAGKREDKADSFLNGLSLKKD